MVRVRVVILRLSRPKSFRGVTWDDRLSVDSVWYNLVTVKREVYVYPF